MPTLGDFLHHIFYFKPAIQLLALLIIARSCDDRYPHLSLYLHGTAHARSYILTARLRRLTIITLPLDASMLAAQFSRADYHAPLYRRCHAGRRRVDTHAGRFAAARTRKIARRFLPSRAAFLTQLLSAKSRSRVSHGTRRCRYCLRHGHFAIMNTHFAAQTHFIFNAMMIYAITRITASTPRQQPVD